MTVAVSLVTVALAVYTSLRRAEVRLTLLLAAGVLALLLTAMFVA